MSVEKLYFSCKTNNLNNVQHEVELDPAIVRRKRKFSREYPFYIAICYGNLDIVKYLLENGAYLRKRCIHGLTGMHFACKQKNPEILLELCNCGGNIHEKDCNKWNCLHYACMFGNFEIANILIDMGDKYS